jgi:Ca2+-binding EF-hand superfamily protein
LTKKEIKRLLGKLNLKLKAGDIRKKFKVNFKRAHSSRFQEVDVDASKTLDFNEFIVFLERLRIRPEIEEILNKASNKKGHLTAEEFLKFLQTVQKVLLPILIIIKLRKRTQQPP